MDELPSESLEVVRQFAEYLRYQAELARLVVAAEASVPYLYPNVATPVSNMRALSSVLDEGYDGDSVLDIEALHNGD